MGHIAVVDDDAGVRTLFQRVLERAGHQVYVAETVKGLNQLLDEHYLEMLLLDVHLPDGRGDQLVGELIARDPFLMVVMISGDASLDTAISATKNGAYHYLTKPFTIDTLQHMVGQALTARAQKIHQTATERTTVRSIISGRRLIGSSPQICAINLLIDRVAKTPSTPVLVTGESGTGKEMVGQAIHELSSRRDNPLIKVNCSAIPRPLIEAELFGHERGAFTDARETRKGLFELAEGGTIFLDEIGELDLAVQPKLLRVLEDRKVMRIGSDRARPIDVRVVAATNRNLQKMVQRKEFREDLFFRLNVVNIHMPPLRNHPEDIEALAHVFLREKCMELGKKVSGFAAEVLDFFNGYHWPGNVRELRNMVERLIILADSDTIQLDQETLQRYCFQPPKSGGGATTPLPISQSSGQDPMIKQRSAGSSTPLRPLETLLDGGELLSLEEMEKRYLMHVMNRLAFNKTHAAQKLGISRSTLQRKISGYGLEQWVEQNRSEGSATQGGENQPKPSVG
jgi:DNA-binding NtrC family response regulator